MTVGDWTDARDAERNERREPDGREDERISRVESIVHVRQLPDALQREAFESGGEMFRLHRDDVHVLKTAGTFRAVAVEDLAADRAGAMASAGHLLRAGLIETHAYYAGENATRVTVVSLSARGQQLLAEADPRSSYRAGPRRLNELAHDAAVYRAFRTEVGQLTADGNSVTSVRTEDELKRLLWAPAAPEDPRDADDRRLVRAASMELPVDERGQVQIPDLQISYTDGRGEVGRVNVEVITRQYTGAQRAAKERAGFRCYRVE